MKSFFEKIKPKFNVYKKVSFKLKYKFTQEELNSWIKHDNPWVRYDVAHHGYGLDKLVFDKHYLVRAEVARQGYGLDILVNDEEWSVRCEVAYQGYCLDILVNDRNWFVRKEAEIEVKKRGL